MADIRIEEHGDRLEIYCAGEWRVMRLGATRTALLEQLIHRRAKTVYFDLEGIAHLDTAGALLLHALARWIQTDGREVQFVHASARTEATMAMTQQHAHPGVDYEVERPGALETLGRRTHGVVQELGGLLSFIGRIFVTFSRILFIPGQLRLKETAYQINESAIKALGIIALTMFLVGVVVAYQSATQLKMYGANIFIVDALGISILRELAPMLTAIVVAGRSGSSFAAQIGVMKMTEEIDAMRTMGFDPYAFLVLPRLLALMIMMPILIFFADIFGLFGGMLIAHAELGLSASLFMDRFVEAVPVKHFWVGAIKGPFFAILIASIGIYRGLQVKNDTESIGTNTTRSVVEAIFAVIICDALFSIVFTKMGF